MVGRDESPGGAEANNSKALILADHAKAEHFLIEIDRALQIGDLNADMVDVRAAEIEVLLGSGGRAASQHGETLNQFSATE
jgi:hypothetical protein